MKQETKKIISNVIGCIALIAMLYIGYWLLVTIVCLDGTPKGSLYYDLGMQNLTEWVKALLIKLR